MMDTDTPPLHRHFNESRATKSHASNDRNAALPCRHFDRSGAEWRNLTPQMAKTPTRHSSFRPQRSEVEKSHSPMAGSIATGDLSTQRFNSPEVFISIPPCPSARDDGGDRQHTVISKGQMTETPPCPVVISTEAKWRNLTPQMAETLPPTRHFDESAAEQLNLTSPWYTRMAAGGPSS